MKKRLISSAAILLLCVGFGVRIWYVNATAFSFPVEKYKMGEWVSLDGCFFESAAETAKGYSVKVIGAQKLLYADYMKKYHLSEDEDLGYGSPPKYVLDVEFAFRADKNSENGIQLFQYRINAIDDSVSYNVQSTLTALTVPALANSYFMTFAVRPGTEHIVHFPFVLGHYPSGIWQEDTGKMPKYLTVSTVPVEKLIEVDF